MDILGHNVGAHTFRVPYLDVMQFDVKHKLC